MFRRLPLCRFPAPITHLPGTLRLSSTKPPPTVKPVQPIASLARKTIPPRGTLTLGPSVEQAAQTTQEVINKEAAQAGSPTATEAPASKTPATTAAPLVKTTTETPTTANSSPPNASTPPETPNSPADYLRRTRFITTLSTRPLSSTLTFLLLHEVTALVPLLSITTALHYTDPIPLASVSSYLAETFSQSLDTFSLWFARNDLFGFSLDLDGRILGREAWNVWVGVEEGETGEVTKEAVERYKLVSHVALAYAITKVLMPLRLWASAIMTPSVVNWMAKVSKKIDGAIYWKPKKAKVIEAPEVEEPKLKVVRRPRALPRKE